VWQEFKELAARERKPMSKILMELVTQYLKAHGKGNPSFRLDVWAKDPGFLAYPALMDDWNQWPWEKTSPEDLSRMEAKGVELQQRARAEVHRRWRCEK